VTNLAINDNHVIIDLGEKIYFNNQRNISQTGVFLMSNRADSCNWYNPSLEAQLCSYFNYSQENLLTVLDGRAEKIIEEKKEARLIVSFVTPQQKMSQERVELVFRLPMGESPQFEHLCDYYYTYGLHPEYRVKMSAPDPQDFPWLQSIN